MKKIRARQMVLLLVLCLFCLFSCASSLTVVGRWQTEVEDEELGKTLLVYHFTEDGEIFLEQKQGDQIPFSIYFGTYRTDGDTILIDDGTSTVQYDFSLEENDLSFFLDGKRQMTFDRV